MNTNNDNKTATKDLSINPQELAKDIQANFPPELLAMRRWVTHDAEKRPYSAITGRLFSQRDDELASFEDALARLSSDRGLGFYLGGGVVGIDLDHCVDKEKKALKPWARKVISFFPDAYVELSPSGGGIHILVAADPSFEPVKKKLKGELAQQVFGLAQPLRGKEVVEIYAKDRYFTVTGLGEKRALGHTDYTATLFLVNQAVTDYTHQEPPEAPPSSEQERPIKAWLDLIRTDEKLNTIFTSQPVNDDDPSSQDYRLIMMLFELVGDAPDVVGELLSRSNRVRPKWLDRDDYIPRTIAAARKEWVTSGRARRRVKGELRKFDRREARDKVLEAWKDEIHVVEPYIPAGSSGRPVYRHCYLRQPNGYHRRVDVGVVRTLFMNWLKDELNMDYSEKDLDDLIKNYLHSGPCKKEGEVYYYADNPAYKGVDGSACVVWYKNCGYDYIADKVIYPQPHNIIPAWIDHDLDLEHLDDEDYARDNRLQQALEEWEMPAEDQELLLQAGASAFCASNPTETIIILVGKEGAGKSKYTGIMKHIMKNLGTSKTRISNIASEGFHLGQLPHSFLNIDSDVDYNYIPVTGTLKKIASAEGAEIQKKHKMAEEMNLPTTLLLAMNDIPRVGDLSPAWLDRLLIFTFTKKFRYTNDEDPNLDLKLQADVTKIILQHHHALRRFFAGTRRLKRSSRMREALEIYEAEINPVKAWIDEEVVEDVEKFLPTSVALAHFNKWQVEQGQKQWGIQKFSKTLLRTLKTTTTQRRINNQRKKGVEGYTLAIHAQRGW